MLKLTTKDIITFNRVPYYLCKGYELIIHYNDNTKEKIYIENTQTANPVKEKEEVAWNKSLTWKLPSNIIATNATDISVFINNIDINSIYYNYNKLDKLITIDGINVTANDIVEIEYTCDKISYTNVNQSFCSYNVFPIYNNNYKIGQHTKL